LSVYDHWATYLIPIAGIVAILVLDEFGASNAALSGVMVSTTLIFAIVRQKARKNKP